jgi:RNA polymerase sigma factor (sigma-70 family)
MPSQLTTHAPQVATDLALAVWENPFISPAAQVEAVVRQQAATHGLALEQVLGLLDDESLLLCVRREVFFKQAFDELWRRHSPGLVLWFRRWTDDQHAAFDLTQELCLKLYVNQLGACDPRHPKFDLLWFLYRAAYHLFVQKHHRGRKHPQLPEDFDPPHPVPDEDLVENRELARLLEEAIERLVEPDRTVMRLSADDFPCGDIAAMTSLSLREVYRIRCERRRQLAKALGIPLPPTKRGRPRKDRDRG